MSYFRTQLNSIGHYFISKLLWNSVRADNLKQDTIMSYILTMKPLTESKSLIRGPPGASQEGQDIADS